MDGYINPTDLLKHKETLTRILDIGLKFKCREKVVGATKSTDFDAIMAKVYEKNPPEHGIAMADILDEFENHLLPFCTNWASPYAMAFNDTGNAFAGIAGDVLATLINQNVINWRPCSPIATAVEMTVLNWLRQLLGYPCAEKLLYPADVAGMVTAGGVSSNAIATVMARERALPNTLVSGMGSNTQNVFVIVPDGIDHYRLSAGWIGIGEVNVLRGKTKNFAYDLTELRAMLNKVIEDGGRVIMLICYAGDSRSMTFDNFVELREICNKYGIWMHVDGCQGTQLVFSRRLRGEKLKGIELSDSVTMDPHKILNIPYSISVLLLRDPKHMELIRRPEDIITGEEHSFGQLTPFFGSRNFMSLKLYFLIKNLGLNGLEKVIDRRCHMATILSAEISRMDRLLQINEKVDLNSVIFMYFPRDIRRQLPELSSTETRESIISIMNEINVSIQENLFSEGDVWLHTFLIPDLSNALQLNDGEAPAKLRPLRFMSGNPILGEKHILLMLGRVVAEGDKILRSRLENMEMTDAIRKILSSFQFHADTMVGFFGVNGSNVAVNGTNAPDREFRIDVDKGFSIRNSIASVTAADSYYMTRDEFCKRKTDLMLEIRRFCATEFVKPSDYIVVVYGSYGYGMTKPNSDLDIVFYCKDEYCTDVRRAKVIAFVADLHKKYQMQVDNEIPYESKMLLPYSFLRSACQGDGISTTNDDGDSRWLFPEILKSKEYLTSGPFLLRFFMGVFSNPHFFVCGNVQIYNECEGLANRNLVRAVMSINGKKKVTSKTMVEHYCCSPCGRFGDFFLGASNREPFTSHLLELLEMTLGTMNLTEVAGDDGTLYIATYNEDLAPERFCLNF